MHDERVSLTQHAAHYVKAALRVSGADVLRARPPADSDNPDVVGIKLFRLIFADQIAQNRLDGQLAAVAHEPDGQAAQGVLESLVSDALEDRPDAAGAVLETLAEFYRRQAQTGNVQAMADLGNLLYWEDDRDGARAAYQQAIDAGQHEALIDMAHLLRFTDNGAARACLDQAMTVGDPGLSAHALVTLGLVLWGSGPEHSDPVGAESALLRAIQTGHPDWAPAAMCELGDLRSQQGDEEGAQAAFQQAIETGHAVWAGEAHFSLATMLEEHGDLAGTREHFQRLVDMGHEHWASAALESLVQQMRDDGDLDSLRALHDTAVQTGNWSAPEVLVAFGDLLDERGDTAGARTAYQQAIDDGYCWADDLIEKLHPSPEPTAAELDALPPPFDPRNMVRTGIEVLSHGLRGLPEDLSYLMAIPVASWTAEHSAVVLFLKFERHGRKHEAWALHVTYSRDNDGWTPHRHFVGTGYSHDPIANPGGLRDLGGRAMVTGGGTDTQPRGRASPAVKYIALIQDGREDLRPLESHFGAWVVSTEERSPFQVEGRDADGNVLASISYEPTDDPGSLSDISR